MRSKLFLIPCCASLLAGCSTIDGTFPSLAKRPIEGKVSMRAPDILPDAPSAPASAAQRSAIDAALARVRDGEAAFRKQLAATGATIAAGRGAAPGSDAWANAQMAVSALEAARAPSVEGLAAIDRLRVEAEALPDKAGLDAVRAARSDADAVVGRQTGEIRSRAASLRTR